MSDYQAFLGSKSTACPLSGFDPQHAMSLQLPHRIYKITYQRPWGVCTINTAQFKTEDELRVGFAKSYPGCELLSVEDVTTHFFPANK
jgi:hypothetical protein